jgi:hypothetical protein
LAAACGVTGRSGGAGAAGVIIFEY